MGEVTQVESAEAAKRPRRRRRGRSRGAGRQVRSRLRLVYFGLASLWGTIAGTVAVVAALAAIGRPIEPHPMLAAAVGVGAMLAVAGGFVAANAYRQASRR